MTSSNKHDSNENKHSPNAHSSTKEASSDNKTSSAQYVDEYLQILEANTHLVHAEAQVLEEQVFNNEELARLINRQRLQTLMDTSDDFLKYLGAGFDEFDKR